MMLTVRRFHDGGVLYNQVVSIYGPLYYLYESIPHFLNGAPVSQDSVRMVTVFLRVVGGLVFFLLVYRMTGSLVLSLAAHYVAFRALAFMGAETAHPQEICILALIAVPLAACARRPVALAWFGILCAAMTLSKINLGIFAIASLAVVLSMALPRGPIQRAVSNAIALAAILLPFALMKPHLNQPFTLRFAILASLSITAALISARTNRIEPVQWTDIAIGLLAGVTAALLIASFVLTRGTTIGGMVHSLIVIPSTRFVQVLNIQLPLRRLMVAWGAANLVLAMLASRASLPGKLVALLKLAFGAIVVYYLGTDQFPELLGPAIPMLWLVAAPGGRPTPGGGLLRPLLAVLGSIHVLYAFPVAGWQTAFVSVLMVAAAALCVWDTLPWLASVIPTPVTRLAPTATVTLTVVLTLSSAYAAYSTFHSREPLNLPGASHLRLDPRLTATLRQLDEEVKSCSILATLPGLPSFNLRSGKPLPSGTGGGPWMFVVDKKVQDAAVREMESQPHPCAIYYPKAMDIWVRDGKLASTPLVRYILNDLQPKFESNGYRFLTKGESPSVP